MYYKKSVKKVIDDLNTSLEGLDEEEASLRLSNYGLNVISDDKKVSKFSLFIKQFQDTMIIMLLIVSVISFFYSYFMHESYTDSILIVFIVFLNAMMGFLQESKD